MVASHKLQSSSALYRVETCRADVPASRHDNPCNSRLCATLSSLFTVSSLNRRPMCVCVCGVWLAPCKILAGSPGFAAIQFYLAHAFDGLRQLTEAASPSIRVQARKHVKSLSNVVGEIAWNCLCALIVYLSSTSNYLSLKSDLFGKPSHGSPLNTHSCAHHGSWA